MIRHTVFFEGIQWKVLEIHTPLGIKSQTLIIVVFQTICDHLSFMERKGVNVGTRKMATEKVSGKKETWRSDI